MADKNWIPVDLLRVFLAVSDSKYLNAAAQRLNQTPSAVSQSIKALENQLTVKLFERDSRPLVHTAAGRKLFTRGRELMRLSESLYQDIRDEEKILASLRLGLSESAAGSYGPWIIAGLGEQTEDLEVQSGLTYVMSRELETGKIDILISPEGFLDNEQFDRLDFLEEDYLIVAKKGVKPFASLSEFRDFTQTHPLISYTKQSSDRMEMDRILRSIGMAARPIVSVSTSYLLVGLVSRLDGWSIVTPMNLWTAGFFINDVDFFPIPGRQIRRHSWIISRVGGSAKMQRVVHETAVRAVNEHLIPKMRVSAPGLVDHFHTLER